MPEQNIVTKPEFIYLDRETELPNRMLHEHIYEKPEVYRTLLAAGGVALFLANKEEEDVVGDDPAQRLRRHFTDRHDFDVVYDDQTEDALKKDVLHAKLLQDHQTQSRYRKQLLLSGSNKAKEEDTKGIDIMNNIRQHRLAFFVGRVIEYQAKTKTTRRKLPAAV